MKHTDVLTIGAGFVYISIEYLQPHCPNSLTVYGKEAISLRSRLRLCLLIQLYYIKNLDILLKVKWVKEVKFHYKKEPVQCSPTTQRKRHKSQGICIFCLL